jgi:hypothetical protein
MDGGARVRELGQFTAGQYQIDQDGCIDMVPEDAAHFALRTWGRVEARHWP